MAPTKWRNSEVENLIHLISNLPFLYDNKDKKYNDRLSSEESWRLIAEELPGRKIVECKEKWAILRSQYRKLWSNGEEHVRQSRWAFAEDMKFMDPYYREKFAISSQEQDNVSNVSSVNIKQERFSPTHVNSNSEEFNQNQELEYSNVEFLLEDCQDEPTTEEDNYETIVIDETQNRIAKKRKSDQIPREMKLESECVQYLQVKKQKLSKSLEDRDREYTENATDDFMRSLSSEMKKLPPDIQSSLKIQFMQRVHDLLYEQT